MTAEAVDAVVLWVDGTDPDHLAKRQHYAGTEANLARNANHPTRFADSGELRFNLRLIQKNAPWLRRLHLVTDGQRPNWLTPDLAHTLKVNIVDHREIYSGHENLLPVFNSRSIESLIHRIPGLSDEFLYFNDDFFLISETKKSDFFDPFPVLRGVLRPCCPGQMELIGNEIVNFLARFWTGTFRDGYIGPAAEQQLLKIRHPIQFTLAHTPVPVRRLDLEQQMETYNGLRNAGYRFRSNEQFYPLGLLATTMLAAGRASVGPTDWEYIHPTKHAAHVVRQRLSRCKNDRSIKSLCVQSMDEAPAMHDMIETYLKGCL